jgi:hypothetical protein
MTDNRQQAARLTHLAIILTAATLHARAGLLLRWAIGLALFVIAADQRRLLHHS